MSLFSRQRGHFELPRATNRVATTSSEQVQQGTFCAPGERMLSRVLSIYFTVHIDGTWQFEAEGESSQNHNSVALSRHYLREQARQTLAHYSVLDTLAAQDAVNVAVARPLHPTPGLTIYGTVQVTVRKRERELAQEHLRAEQSGEVEREEIRRRITFLHRVLSDPDLRLVWWIDNHPDRLGELAELVKQTENLRTPHDASHDLLRDEIVRFVDQLLADIRTPQQREIFLRVLTEALRTLGSSELQVASSQWLRTIVSEAEAAST